MLNGCFSQIYVTKLCKMAVWIIFFVYRVNRTIFKPGLCIKPGLNLGRRVKSKNYGKDFSKQKCSGMQH